MSCNTWTATTDNAKAGPDRTHRQSKHNSPTCGSLPSGTVVANSCMPHELPFASLSEDAAAAVRERQLRRKQAKLERKQQARVARASSITHLQSAGDESTSGSYSDWISKAQYFEAVPAGLFLPPGGATIDAVRRVLDACDAELKENNYFLFGFGSDEAWDPAFNARLLYEGFFTITARLLGAGTEPLPLPELQPYYGQLGTPIASDLDRTGPIREIRVRRRGLLARPARQLLREARETAREARRDCDWSARRVFRELARLPERARPEMTRDDPRYDARSSGASSASCAPAPAPARADCGSS